MALLLSSSKHRYIHSFPAPIFLADVTPMLVPHISIAEERTIEVVRGLCLAPPKSELPPQPSQHHSGISLSADEHQIRRRWTSSQSKVARAIVSAPLPYPKVIFCHVRVNARGPEGQIGSSSRSQQLFQSMISVKKDKLARSLILLAVEIRRRR